MLSRYLEIFDKLIEGRVLIKEYISKQNGFIQFAKGINETYCERDSGKCLNGCEIGSAKMTDAYRLPSKKIIHACGPIFYENKERAPIQLKKCYKKYYWSRYSRRRQG